MMTFRAVSAASGPFSCRLTSGSVKVFVIDNFKGA